MDVKPADVPVFILAGGLGTRISEESHLKPKPMIEIGETPILVHIMRWYYAFGFNNFVICAGYRSWEIKEYFLTYEFRRNHLVIDHRLSADGAPFVPNRCGSQERWKVHVIDTGLKTMTGARLARAMDEVDGQYDFDHIAVTYGDGVCDIDLRSELAFHLQHGQIGTVMGVPPPARWGELDVYEDHRVGGFLEKPQDRQGLINGGYFFFRKEFREFLRTDPDCVLEQEPIVRLAGESELMMFAHQGFWHPMDTLRDRNHLQGLWESDAAPWQVPDEVRPGSMVEGNIADPSLGSETSN